MKVFVHASGRIAVEFAYSPEAVSLVRSCPSAKFLPAERVWVIERDGLVVSSVARLRSAGFEVSAEVEDLLAGVGSPLQGQNLSLQSELPLYDFQRKVAIEMVEKGSCINASFVGAGKSLTFLGVIDHLKSQSNLIVCPKSVLGQWKNEILKWMPRANVFMVSGDPPSRKRVYEMYAACGDQKFLLVTYDTIRIDVALIVVL